MKLALLFDHFGPYHLARLRAAAAMNDTVGIEFAARSGEYAWDLADRSGLTIFTLPKGRDWSSSLTARLTECAPDAVAVPGWSSKGALETLRWCLSHRVPAVVMSESTAHDEKRQPWKEIPKRRIVSLFSAGLAGGRAHADYLFQLGMCRTRIFLGYDAVDNAHFARPQRLSEPVGEGFLASARFVEKKNLPNLLRAYAIYVKSCAADEAWPLTLLGDGDLRPRLEAMVSELGLQDLVTMPGFKQYQELPGYYRAARVFIHASTTEQWGLVVNEAMAAGLPVIVSNRCGCAPDLVRGGVNGYAFNPFDVEEMARAMMKMTKLPEDRLVTMGQESARIIAEWGPERFARGLSDATVCAREQEPLKASMLDSLLLKVLTRR